MFRHLPSIVSTHHLLYSFDDFNICTFCLNRWACWILVKLFVHYEHLVRYWSSCLCIMLESSQIFEHCHDGHHGRYRSCLRLLVLFYFVHFSSNISCTVLFVGILVWFINRFYKSVTSWSKGTKGVLRVFPIYCDHLSYGDSVI